MPAISTSSKVLVTGASGYIAVWVVLQLLERGYKVRGTVRSEDKGEYLKELFKEYGDGFEFVIAEDLEKEGAFDEAVKGVDAVLHTASPFHFNVEGDPLGKLINPAVNGTNNVLNSIHKHGDKVQRVVVTSSYAAILDSTKPVPQTFTEEDWNESSPANVEKLGNRQEGSDAYRASKTLAERAAWRFVKEKGTRFDLVTINPPLVLGPAIHEVHSPDKLNTSVANIWNLFHGSKSDGDLPGPAGCFVDVRDVAWAHVESLSNQEAGGQRFGCSNGKWSWQDASDVLSVYDRIPEEWRKSVPVGKRGGGREVVQNDFDGSKATRVLGVKYHSLKDCLEATADSLVDLEQRGWKGIASRQILELGSR
ncbi:NAD(P)-binding protein [Violaceomyces palustris]|uniref:NAD(P)-binding protein n=1 Tax=Violaceomyces palustris TaxID=1673888 RepID=A0ACD0NXC5_9BASI|nr:NAD(P)-binding protein [Violaceomyces palustris]